MEKNDYPGYLECDIDSMINNSKYSGFNPAFPNRKGFYKIGKNCFPGFLLFICCMGRGVNLNQDKGGNSFGTA